MGNILPTIAAQYMILLSRLRIFRHSAMSEIPPFHILAEDVPSF